MPHWDYQALNIRPSIVVNSWLSQVFSAHRTQLLVMDMTTQGLFVAISKQQGWAMVNEQKQESL
jgi:hypothetical protein